MGLGGSEGAHDAEPLGLSLSSTARPNVVAIVAHSSGVSSLGCEGGRCEIGIWRSLVLPFSLRTKLVSPSRTAREDRQHLGGDVRVGEQRGVAVVVEPEGLRHVVTRGGDRRVPWGRLVASAISILPAGAP